MQLTILYITFILPLPPHTGHNIVTEYYYGVHQEQITRIQPARSTADNGEALK